MSARVRSPWAFALWILAIAGFGDGRGWKAANPWINNLSALLISLNFLSIYRRNIPRI